MTGGALLLSAMTALLVLETFLALYFRSLIDRVEGGEKVWMTFNPPDARKMVNTIHIMMPIMWVFAALISFGLIPLDGIDPIKF
jgi:hypothetical protein